MKLFFLFKNLYFKTLFFVDVFGEGKMDITKLWFCHSLVSVAIQRISVALKANLPRYTTLVSVLVWVFPLFFMFCIDQNIHIRAWYTKWEIFIGKKFSLKKIIEKKSNRKPLNSHNNHLCYSTKFKLLSHLAVTYCLRCFIYGKYLMKNLKIFWKLRKFGKILKKTSFFILYFKEKLVFIHYIPTFSP